ncbi:hypothetical protein PRJ39_16650 [Lysobacter enzymogenes]|uniref:hypothetical protein n=1 Tax=Lysobacter enzymogenes TaxID=69 RepID=UPI003747E06B
MDAVFETPATKRRHPTARTDAPGAPTPAFARLRAKNSRKTIGFEKPNRGARRPPSPLARRRQLSFLPAAAPGRAGVGSRPKPAAWCGNARRRVRQHNFKVETVIAPCTGMQPPWAMLGTADW